MALNDATLKSAIQAFMEDVSEGKTASTAAQQLTDAISAYVRSGTIGPGTFAVTSAPGVVAGSTTMT